MAEIKISGKKVLRTINREFNEQFPYLGLHFYTPEEWEKARKNAKTIHSLDMGQRLAAVRKTVPAKSENIWPLLSGYL